MSEAVKELILYARSAQSALTGYSGDRSYIAVQLGHAIAAVEAELNAVPAVTDKECFDGRSTDYPDWVENYR